jgi:hypothetical protein
MQALLMPKPKSAVPKPDGMLSSTKPSMEGLYPVLIVMCVHYFIASCHRNTKSQWNITLLPMYERYDLGVEDLVCTCKFCM